MDADLDTDLDTLATARYVTIDELLNTAPHLAPLRPAVGIVAKLTDAELVTLTVLQALLGYSSEARWLRYADRHLRHLVSLSARPIRRQQAPAPASGAHRPYHPGHRHRHRAVDR